MLPWGSDSVLQEPHYVYQALRACEDTAQAIEATRAKVTTPVEG